MRPTSLPPTTRLLRLAARQGSIRARDATALGIHSEYLTRLTAAGVLLRTGRGTYVSAAYPLSSNHSLAEAARRFPAGVICLLSAARFHELGTLSPRRI